MEVVCEICCEEPVAPYTMLRASTECAHEFCVLCLGQYMRGHLGASKIPCPKHKCGAALCEDSIREVLGHEVYDQLRKRRLLSLPSSPQRMCPKCDAVCERGGPSSSVIVCSSCSHSFCAQHGDAHPQTETCAAFEERTKADGSGQEVARISKPCPTCGMAIELESGCTHVMCVSCRTDFCYQCGSANLRGTLIRTCPRCSAGYLVHRYLFVWFVLWVLLLPFWFLYSSLALVFFGLAFLLVTCARCCAGVTAKDCLKLLVLIFLPFAFILDLSFQACHCSCACGPCRLPMSENMA